MFARLGGCFSGGGGCFPVFGFLLWNFPVWSVFFYGWCGFFGVWVVRGVAWFFVSLSYGFWVVIGRGSVPLCLCGVRRLRLVARVRVVRTGRAAGARLRVRVAC